MLALVLVFALALFGCGPSADEEYDRGYYDGYEDGYVSGFYDGYYDGYAEGSKDEYAPSTKSQPPSSSSDRVYAEDGYAFVSRTGTKYHSHNTCSGMSEPYYMLIEEAESMGRTPCSKCY